MYSMHIVSCKKQVIAYVGSNISDDYMRISITKPLYMFRHVWKQICSQHLKLFLLKQHSLICESFYD